MSFEELHKEIQQALRSDPAKARPLVRRYARRAAKSGDALRRAEARFERAQLDQVTGRLRDAAAGYAVARAAFARRAAKKHQLAAEVGSVQVLALLGRADAARRSAKRLRRLATDPVQAAAVEIAVGSSLDALGDEREAEACFRRALERLGARRKPPAPVLRATARHNLGIRLARRGAVAEALAMLDRALAFYLERGMEADADVARHNRGWAHAVGGNAAAAFEDLRRARDAQDARGNRRLAALALADEAELLLRLGDEAAGADRAREAARGLARAGAPVEAARAGLVAARASGSARQAARAREAFRAAGDDAGAAQANVLLGEDLARAETTLLRSGHVIGALDALLARARALPPGRGAALLGRRAGRYPRVLRRWVLPDLYRLRAEGAGRKRVLWLRRAVRAAEELRLRAPTGSLRATVLAARLEGYEALALALLERGRPRDVTEAFLVLDMARARTLREEMDKEAPGLLDRPAVRRIRERLEALWRALERGENRGENLRSFESRLLREVASCERELLEAIAEAEGRTAGAAAARELPRDPCLAFAAVSGRLVGLLSHRGGVHAWACGTVGQAREELEAFRFQVTRRLFGSADAAPAEARLEALARRLLGGAPDLGKRLRVVLPPELGSLPVEALPVDGRPLLETTRVTYAPSACGSAPAWRRGGRALLVGIGSAGLPEVASELATVRRRLGDADVLRDATRDGILGELRGRRVVHLAGHARARVDLPSLSALRVRDGWLAAADLQGAGPRNALVVLSACRTGDPSLRFRGEALAGFPRALLAAGAAGIVASRWEIPDDVAHAWMRSFYDHLRDTPPDAALAAAALDMRRTHPHPADWAAFLLVRGGNL